MSLDDLDNIASNFQQDFASASAGETFVGRCAVCDQQITDDKYKLGPGENTSVRPKYHTACLKCHKCQKECSDNFYLVEKDKKVLCEEHYFEANLSKCDKCGDYIKDRLIEGAAGRKYHASCFVCAKCNTSLDGKEYMMKDESSPAMCSSCFNDEYGVKCTGCEQQITANGPDGGKFFRIGTEGMPFHPSCYKCKQCKTALAVEGDKAVGVPYEGNVVCATCYPGA
eukprot:Clim_evm53s136 gene=Clim_evmTU53s136